MSELAALRCLVTGGLGFVGSNLARAAAARGASVTVVDNLLHGSGGRSDHVADAAGAIAVVRGDARDLELMRGLVQECDAVFALAGTIGHAESMEHAAEDLEHNLRTALTTLEAVRQVNPGARVLFTSTRQVYGRPQYLPVDERHPVAPVDVNGIHKAAAEQYHRLYAEVYGVRTTCLRLTNTYGPRQLIAHNRHGFVGWFARLVLENRTITLFGDGSQRRDFLYVDDAVEAILRAALAETPPGAVYNVPGAEVASLADVARRMCAIGGGGRVELAAFPPERQAIDIGDYYADGSRLAAAIAWQPAVALDEGLERMFAYYQPRWREYLETC